MNILITGGTGFLGSHLAESLKEIGNVDFTSRKKSKDANSIQMDFSKVPLTKKYDVIVHNAAFIPSPEHENNAECSKINCIGTKFLVENCVDRDSTLFIYVGSLAIYGTNTGLISEVTEPQPNTDYSRSKYMGEGHLPDGSYIVRPGTIYGSGMLSSRFISYALKEIRQNNDIQIYYPNQQFHLIHVDDVIDCIKKIIKNRPAKKIYNLCSETITKMNLCEIIKRQSSSTSRIDIKKAAVEKKLFNKQYSKCTHKSIKFKDWVGDKK